MRANGDQPDKVYIASLGRALGGALLFGLPLLMTMEMWELGGFRMERSRLLIFLLGGMPMLLGLSYFVGFEPTFRLKDEVLDALAAFGIGFLLSAVMLALLGVLGPDAAMGDLIGRVALCAMPAAIGALLAGKQFVPDGKALREQHVPGYWGALFLMAVGAIFLAFNVAPTEEMVVISHYMTEFHALALIALSVAALHVLVYVMGFPGQDRRQEAGDHLQTFARYTLPGYGLALAISFYCLWTFGRLDGVAFHQQAIMTAVLAFPSALGAATARLVI